MAEHDLNKIVDDEGEVFNLRDNTKQPTSDRVTSWSSPTDAQYPSAKLVKDSLDAKAPNAPSEVTIANGDKIIIADSSDSNKVKRASVAFDGSTTKNFLSKKGTFEEVKESEVAWGGDFHTDLSPIEMGLFPQNLIANPPPENIKYEKTTDGGETWSVVSLTDSQKKQFCNLTSGVTLPAGPTTTDDNVLPLQRGRVTIALLPFGATEYSDTWCYGQVKRILLYINRSSSPEVAHCVVEVQTGPHFIANDGVWTTLGDYNVSGDGGWNSIPIGDILGGYSSQLSGRRVAIRFTYWVTKKPTSGSGGRISLYSLGILPGTVWKSNANYVAKQKLPVQVENDGTGIVQKSRSLVTARKLAISLSNTSTDTSFDGSADVTNIKTTGTLAPGNGGTGKTSLKAAEYNLTTGKSEISDNTSGDDRVVFELASPSESNGVTRGFRKLSTIWAWIKGLLSSESGVNISGSSASCTGNAATATTATNVSSNGAASNSTARHIWFSDSTTETMRVHDDNLMYTPSTNTVSANISGNAATATTAKDYDTSSGTIKTALAGKSDTSHTHKTDGADVTADTAGADLGDATDTMEFVTTNTAGYSSSAKLLYRRPATKIWNWIKSKLGISSGKGGSDTPVFFNSSGEATACNEMLRKNGGNATDTCTNALLSALPNNWSATPTDNTYLIRRDTNGNASFGQVKFSTVWSYIKGKLSSDSSVDTNGTALSASIAKGYTISTYDNGTKRAQIGIASVDTNSKESSMSCIVRLDCISGPGGLANSITILVALECRGSSRHIRAEIINDNNWSSTNRPVIVVFMSDSGSNMHVCVALANSSNALQDFTFTRTRVLPLAESVNWSWTFATDSGTSYEFLHECYYPNADTVDGYHINVGNSYSSSSDVISFY